jgi:type I restriction enzyme M protein
MIDGSKILTKQRAQNILSDGDVDRLYRLYADFKDVEDFAKVVTIDDIAAKDYDLSVNKYVKYHEEEVRSYEEVKDDFDAALAEVESATAKFRNLLAEGGFLTRRSGEAEAVQ